MQTDTDQDGLADHLEDTNQNGVTDPGETDARLVDTDQDGLSDALEDRNRNGRVDPGETDPRRADTDGDRIPDGVEDRNRNGRWDPGETSPTARCTGGHCRVLEDVDSPNRGPLVPEPMVVDLVRNLGAMQGELEANVLFMLPLRNPWVPYWAPEVEIAFATGWAVELEVPIVGLHVDAFKLGLQGTLGVSTNQRLATGVQWLLEARSDGSHVHNTLLWLGAARFSERFSAFLLAGFDVDVSTQTGAVRGSARVHPTLYAELTRAVTIGCESRLALSSEGLWGAAVVPQLRLRPADPLTIQVGAGAEFDGSSWHGLVATRVALEH